MRVEKTQLIEAGSAEMDRMASVIDGTVAFNASDYRRLRELTADLQRQDDVNLSLYGRKLIELYRHVEKFVELRKSYPAQSRPVRKVCEAAVKTVETLERIGERLEADVYRKAGEKYGA